MAARLYVWQQSWRRQMTGTSSVRFVRITWLYCGSLPFCESIIVCSKPSFVPVLVPQLSSLSVSQWQLQVCQFWKSGRFNGPISPVAPSVLGGHWNCLIKLKIGNFISLNFRRSTSPRITLKGLVFTGQHPTWAHFQAFCFSIPSPLFLKVRIPTLTSFLGFQTFTKIFHYWSVQYLTRGPCDFSTFLQVFYHSDVIKQLYCFSEIFGTGEPTSTYSEHPFISSLKTSMLLLETDFCSLSTLFPGFCTSFDALVVGFSLFTSWRVFCLSNSAVEGVSTTLPRDNPSCLPPIPTALFVTVTESTQNRPPAKDLSFWFLSLDA